METRTYLLKLAPWIQRRIADGEYQNISTERLTTDIQGHVQARNSDDDSSLTFDSSSRQLSVRGEDGRAIRQEIASLTSAINYVQILQRRE